MLAGLVATFAVLAAQPPALPPEDVAVIEDAYRVWRASADRVWAGWSKSPAPMIYIRPDYEYALGFPASLPGFTPLTGVKVAGFDIQARARTLPVGMSASFPFEGTPAAILGTPAALEKSAEAWAVTAVHEMFHVYQAKRGSYAKIASLQIAPANDSSWQLSFPFPYQDPVPMDLIHLQAYLCWLTATAEDAAYNLGVAPEAIRTYEAWLKKQPDGARTFNYSRFQEWNEGIAAYTEYRVAGEAAQLTGFPRYRELWETTYRDRQFLAKHAGRVSRSRSVFYHLGMAKAMALDRTYPAWKERYFAPGLWLDDLLTEAASHSDHNKP